MPPQFRCNHLWAPLATPPRRLPLRCDGPPEVNRFVSPVGTQRSDTGSDRRPTPHSAPATTRRPSEASPRQPRRATVLGRTKPHRHFVDAEIAVCDTMEVAEQSNAQRSLDASEMMQRQTWRHSACELSNHPPHQTPHTNPFLSEKDTQSQNRTYELSDSEPSSP